MLIVVPAKYTVKETNEKYLGKFVDTYSTVITTDADVYTTEGKLLLKFRKNVIPRTLIQRAVEALGSFVLLKSTDRGTAGGNTEKGLATGHKRPIKSNIIGFYDKYTISMKAKFKKEGTKPTEPCRPCRWNRDNPEQWKQVVPFIQHVDKLYKDLCPVEHAIQLEAANKSKYHIEGTSFSTVTVNHNFRTAGHYDKGDFREGFGNLVVFDNGKYDGGFIGFPRYDVGVDLRLGDFLAMDNHELHANTEMKNNSEEPPVRISFVSYFREAILKKIPGPSINGPIHSST